MSIFGRLSRRLLLVCFICPGVAPQAAKEIDTPYWTEGRTWQYEWHNDAFANSDDQFTNGIKLRISSRLAKSLESTKGTPAVGKLLARHVLPDDRSRYYREVWALGLNQQTPNSLGTEEIILNDFPYLGVVGVSNGFAAFDERRFAGLGLMLGWTGETALGEELQSAAHEITGATDPQGWNNQLDFEPLVNLYYSRKQKLWAQPGFSASVSGDVALGNFFTFGQSSIEFRFGKAPEGFLNQPVPVGRGLEFDASLRAPQEHYTYVSFTARTTGIAYALPRDGNLLRNGNEWTQDNVLDKEPWVQQFILGLHHERPRWGVHLSFWYSSDTVKDNGEKFAPGDLQNSFGTFTFVCRPGS